MSHECGFATMILGGSLGTMVNGESGETSQSQWRECRWPIVIGGGDFKSFLQHILEWPQHHVSPCKVWGS